MKYIGYFRNIDDELFEVNIITNNDGSTSKIIKLGAQPFVTEAERKEDYIFTPFINNTATIQIVNNDYMFDIYSATAQQNKVLLLKNNEVIWTGYISPNLYNQQYENDVESFEVEAVNALSTLKYYDYKPMNDNSKEIVSFYYLINKLLKRCNAFTEFYISNNLKYSPVNELPLIKHLVISEKNFFDADGEAWKCDEVMEHICKYLGLTCIQFKDKVYFVDFEAIKNGINTYHKFVIDNPDETLVTLSNNKDITASDYALNGAQLSLDNVYNKVVVKDNLYTFDSIIPSLWDKDYITNYAGKGHVEEIHEDGKGGKHMCFFKYFKHKSYKSHYYDKVTLQEVNVSNINYAATQKYVGATICKHFSDKVKNYDKIYNDINYKNYLLLHCHNTIPFGSTIKRPLFELDINDDATSLVGGGSTYMIIKGTFLYMDRENEMYIMQGYSNNADNFNADKLFIWARLQMGDAYWNGDQWQYNPCDFKLFFHADQTDHCINKPFQIKNNITWKMGLDGEEGYSIKMPPEVHAGQPKFILYQPYKIDNSYRCDAVWLSNFDIIAKVQNFTSDEEEIETDTEYSNEINSDFVAEPDDIEFKICTWDNKKPNYSAVGYNNGTQMHYLDKVINRATNNNIRCEEHFIYKMVTQYSTISAILNLNLNTVLQPYTTFTDKYMNNKIFIVSEQNIDYANKTNTITLTEKK